MQGTTQNPIEHGREAEAEVVDAHRRDRAAARWCCAPRLGLLREVLPTALPWVRLLPAADLDAIAEEFMAIAKAAAGLGNTARCRSYWPSGGTPESMPT